MFGLVFLSFEMMCHLLKHIRDSCRNFSNKNKYHYSETWHYPMYIDCNGHWRDTKTNELLCVGGLLIDNEVHICIYNPITQSIKKDCTALQKHEFIKKAQYQYANATVYPLSSFNEHRTSKISGIRYKDKQTGDLYVIRRIGNEYCYLRITDGIIVRPIDNSSLKELTDQMKRCNELQRKFQQKGYRTDYYNKFAVD